MPRSAFSVSAFDAATPGMSRLAMAVGSGGRGAFNAARDNEVELQTKLAQAISAMNAHDATADLNRAKAEAERAGLEMQRPEALRRNAMLTNGIPLDEEGSVDNYFRTGQLGGRYSPAADGMGPVDAQPAWAGKLGNVARAIGGVQRALAIGDKNSENVAKAGAIEREGSLSDAIIAGTLDRNTVGGAQAAVAGKPLFHQDSTGGVLDQYGGGLDTSNPLARSTISLRTEQAGQAKAGAAENYAQAESARATAAKTREETTRNARGGDIIQVTQPDGTVLLVNKVTGLSRPAVGADGVPVRGKGSADKPLTEGQAKANLFGARMLESDAILNELAGDGVLRPGGTKQLAEGVAGAIPIIGDKLSEAAGSATNWTQSSAQQRVEQAQRDFINAVLRRESGATIQPVEFANAAKQYFPAVGDSKKTLEQKARNRALAVQMMLAEVPEAQRYKPKPRGKDKPAAPAAPEGSWAAPTGRTVTVDY